MNKEKYQIPRKSDFICMTIILHDLKCFDEELSERVEDIQTLSNKIRNTRNVFVSLHNLKDSMNRIRIDGDAQFTLDTRMLRRDLDFIAHIRNKGVGHLDKVLLERAAQWIPQLFHVNSHENDDYLTFLSYQAILESTINSYLNEDGEQKVFKTEIDILYPPNSKQLFEFLSDIIKRSMSWLERARKIIRSEIEWHSNDKIEEMAFIAAKTNFNLKEESDFTFNEDEMKKGISLAIAKMREISTEENIIQFMENKMLK